MLTVSEVYSSKGIQGKNLKTGTAEKVKPVLFTSLSGSNKVPSKTEFWSENTRAILYNVTKNTGIAPYTPSLLKDDNTAIQHAQMHLIDLLKYYEGDRYHYYEAITVPYSDTYHSKTVGFGELADKPRTQDAAYKKLGETIEQYAGEVKRLLNRRIGKNTYENLPQSVKEGLIDLCYNKGLSRISKNKELMNALKNNDYSTVINNLYYVYPGKTDAEKKENAGLYRRSLNRMMLATRDLQGKELKESRNHIENFYKKTVKYYKKNNVSTTALDKIYENYTTGKISAEPISAESAKINITDKYKGKGIFAVAQDAYANIEDKKGVSFKKFYNEFKKINNDPESIILGTELNVPLIDNIADTKASTANPIVDIEEETVETPEYSIAAETKEPVEKTPKKTFWQKVGDGFKSVFKAIGNFFSGLLSIFTSCSRNDNSDTSSESAEEEQTKFQKMLNDENVKIRKDGDFYVVSGEHTVQKGESIWKIARLYQIDENILCSDNNIKNKNHISEGQTLNIRKLGYKVEKGDNLFRIAKKFGLTVEILKDINNIIDADKIKAGQMLEIPGFIYTVKPKDTLFAISRRVGVKLEDLIKINNLDKNGIISPGQKIKVIYNDSDFAIPSDKKKITVDKATNTKIETVDMSGVVNLKNRELLKEKRKINGRVVATRGVFNPTKSGQLSGKTIIVNAGHGYSESNIDVGAIGRAGLEDEWLINYDNSMILKDKLCENGAKVIFLQGHRRLIKSELHKSQNKADMFISVHVNSNDTPVQDRTQIYYAAKNSSKKLAGIMEKKLSGWIPENETIAEEDKFEIDGEQLYAQTDVSNYMVLKAMEKYQNKPSVLWEVAFMVSPKGRERLSNPELMEDYAQCMTDAVIDYYSSYKKD